MTGILAWVLLVGVLAAFAYLGWASASTSNKKKDEALTVLPMSGAVIQRVEMKPNDVIVLSYENHLSPSTLDAIRDQIERCLPGHPCIVMSDGLQLSFIGRDQVDIVKQRLVQA